MKSEYVYNISENLTFKENINYKNYIENESIQFLKAESKFETPINGKNVWVAYTLLLEWQNVVPDETIHNSDVTSIFSIIGRF